MKKALCVLISLLLLLSCAWAEVVPEEAVNEEQPEAEVEIEENEGVDYDDWEDYWVDYDYKELTVGNVTPMQGQFFTSQWGGSTSDLDVRELLHGYNLAKWDNDLANIRLNHRVVSGAVIMDDAQGNRIYQIALYDDLKYSDGTPITAYDYAFSLLLQMDPAIEALGGKPLDVSWLMGSEDYLAGKTQELPGIRVIDPYQLRIKVKADALPYFYELARLSVKPYPIAEIAPEHEVKDEGKGVFITPALSAELLEKTLLDEQTGYITHPKVVSGPYTLVSFEDGVAHFRINEEYKGNENADIPRIWDLYYKLADNDDMIRQLGDGMFGLLNKVTLSKSLIEGVRLAQTQGHQYTMTNYPRVGLTLIWFTGDRPAVQELAVRQAIAYCLDRQSFTRGYVGPYGMQMDGYYGMGQWMYLLANGGTSYPVSLPENATPEDEEAYEEAVTEWESISLDGLTKYYQDIGQAIQLLENDGWTLGADGGDYDPQRDSARYKMIDGELVGLHLTMALPESVDAERDMQVFFISGLREAGIDVTLKKLDLEELQRMYTGMEQADVDMVYLGENFTILVNPEIFMPGEKDIALNEVRSELYAMAQDMVHTDSGDLLGFMKKWVALQERITQTLPLIPVYSNVYFDFYTRELYDYDIEEAVTWSEAIVSSYMSEPETFDADRNTTVEEELKEMEMILLSGRQREYRTETEN